MNNTISYQNRLFQNRRPTNNKEYNDLCDKLDCVDTILIRSGIESEFAEYYLGKMEAKKKEENGKFLSGKEIRKRIEYAVQALRCNYLRMELGTSHTVRHRLSLLAARSFNVLLSLGILLMQKLQGKVCFMNFHKLHRKNI